ncbi:MAG: dolichyl-phosphate beta-D-mannosyltransferase [Candidatus Buchananbacteria bacterium RIFCSPHIGHO2_01_FULL_44_11]|uniref:Dolichyl-phosphate beta-D-mannosyltransferase n=1 Tax=Candidatus Buchananbacteria bacterium RIFCSPHIGHO2_01_FULL_44_11 TaxID=1797535 RepID=A0A1G1XYP7_9BACT|nr:MAG: dolichyl-phosphate beta-D-mannosyltransferase [Candidatus Buchananbacteria bacterium RIFCSPHIGHO2_01_FULL_44_11]
MAKTYIVIPTYNEKDNVVLLLERIFSLAINDLYVLVVDDNSPDGTGAMVEKVKRQYPNLKILHRPAKLGLGPAYIAGFGVALSEGADYIFEMDADLSHDPRYLPDFLEAIENFDLVLGSRYIVGGGVKNWGLVRRLISRFGNWYARLILGLLISDLTGGFKCYRRQVLEQLDFASLSSVGYNFQIETTYQVYRAGFKIKEIPIVFTERLQGKSKFSFKIILESFWQVILLRFKSVGKRR